MKKFMLRIIPVVLVALVMVSNPLFAVNIYNPGDGIGAVDNLVAKIWGTIFTVLQVCAVAAIVFAGVKYMFASAEGKADLKNGMVGLVIGAVLVFGASTVVKIITSATSELNNV